MAAVGTLLAAGVPYRVGDVVDGKYRIDGILGRGGMGLVAAATHVALDQPVAIKFLKQELVGDEATRARFAREARACVRIRSEHVCRVLDVGEMADGVPYMVMERLEGLDLSQVLKAEGPFEISRAIDCVLQACEGLYEAHRLGIVHRDLKPGNLFLSHSATGQPLVKVLDFGIARTVDAQEGETLTATGSILGSPHYMSPEQIVSPKSVDERSDVWSLAIILYRLLANALPFEADSFGRLAILIAGDHPLSLVARRPDVPPALEKVLFRALEKDPNARYVNVGVFAAALAPYGTIRSMAAAAAPTNSLLAGGPTLAPHVPVPATATGSRVPSITANAMSLSGGSQTQVPPKSAAIPLLIGVAVVLLGALGVTAKVAFGRRDPAPPLTAVPTAPAPVSATIVPVPDNSVHPTVPSSTALPSVSAPPPAAVPPVAVATPAATPRPVATKTPEPAHTSPTHNPLDLGLKR
jgi:serine/threonine-protein kinase